MNHFILRTASNLSVIPWIADFIYGPPGRWLERVWVRLRDFKRVFLPLRIRNDRGSYFSTEHGLSLWTTNICNASCVFCAYPTIAGNKERVTGTMSLGIVDKAVREYAALGGTHVDLTPPAGDPLVDKAIVEKIRHCKSIPGIQTVSLTTNGILLSRDRMYAQLLDAGIDLIAISLGDVDRDIYHRLYGVDRCVQVLHGLNSLLVANDWRAKPCRIIIRFRNARKPSAIIKSPSFQAIIRPHLSSQVTVNFTTVFDNWAGVITESALFGTMKLTKPKPRVSAPCIGLTAFIVMHDGDVRLCGCRLADREKDDLVVGNINVSTLDQIGKSDRVAQIVDGFYRNDRPKVCRDCGFYHSVGGNAKLDKS